MRVFLSYAGAHGPLAEQVYYRLVTAGHRVFFDRTTLAPGDEFDRAIRAEIQASDFMVFLISPESVREGSYTRTELRFARDVWPNPMGRVLPVIVAPTDFAEIPNYLKAVTVLRPEGNIPAEVAAHVNDMVTRGPAQAVPLGRQALDIKNSIRKLRRQQRVEAVKRQWAEESKQYEVIPYWGTSIWPPLLAFGLFTAFFVVIAWHKNEPAAWAMVIIGLMLTVFMVACVHYETRHYRRRLEEVQREIQRASMEDPDDQ